MGEIDEKYMRRAIELAGHGAGFVSPNPMVGAVIVAPDGRIIGEGWHRRYGGPHAEVNAVASVRKEDEYLLPVSTIYVSLEPCSHYGKTPPCSKLLIEKKLKRVVIGMLDPFKEVSGRGVRMIRDAGIEVVENVLENECRALNRRFITAHTLHRPYIQLKWAQSADGFIAATDHTGKGIPVALSNPLSLVEMHSERALNDAILVGTNTILSDNPSLTTRLFPGNSPRPVIFSSVKIPENAAVLQRDPIILDPAKTLEENISELYSRHSITSLMVEGGSRTLSEFIEKRLFDEIRLEISPKLIHSGIPAPTLPSGIVASTFPSGIAMIENRKIRGNTLLRFRLASTARGCQNA